MLQINNNKNKNTKIMVLVVLNTYVKIYSHLTELAEQPNHRSENFVDLPTCIQTVSGKDFTTYFFHHQGEQFNNVQSISQTIAADFTVYPTYYPIKDLCLQYKVCTWLIFNTN